MTIEDIVRDSKCLAYSRAVCSRRLGFGFGSGVRDRESWVPLWGRVTLRGKVALRGRVVLRGGFGFLSAGTLGAGELLHEWPTEVALGNFCRGIL